MSQFIKNLIHGGLVLLCLTGSAAFAQDIKLPDPQKSGGIPLMEAFNKRKSTRDFSNKEIPLQVLSDLLWAAYGYNRPQQKMRTVPSAINVQNMELYVAKSDGLYLYDASSHSLKFVLQDDVRAATGMQAFVKDVPVDLIYVADLSKMSGVTQKGEYYSIAHAGFISQNVYLFCAAFDLGTVVRDMVDREALMKIMKLEGNREIILAQSVGYPMGTSQKAEELPQPESSSLSQNYPNPFNAETQIRFSISENARVAISVFDIHGEKIRTVLNENRPSGEYTLQWDGLNDFGERMASGVYFCQIEMNQGDRPIQQTRKMLMLK
jgi:SagB-type dehydrogenase family enzyme